MRQIADWWHSEATLFSSVFGYGEISYSHGQAVKMFCGAAVGAVTMLGLFTFSALLS